MNQTHLDLISKSLEQCSTEQLESILAPISSSSTSAEMISYCLNKELNTYGIVTYVSPDKTTVLVNDESMCKVLDYFHGKDFKPVLTTEHVERVKSLITVAEKKNVDLLWAQTGLTKQYYY